MNYILFAVINIMLLIFLISKNKSLFLKYILVILLALIILFPKESIDSAKEGINLWIFVLAPSLLPFFIINDILVSLNLPADISYVLSGVTEFLFNTSGYGAYTFILSIFTGYPTAAKIVSELYESNKIDKQEGQKILTFSSTSGPLFIIGTVGVGMLRSPAAGYILYLSHIFGAILNGLFHRNFKKTNYNNDKCDNHNTNNISFGKTFSEAIKNSFITLGFIGGYVIIFSVIIGLLNCIGYFSILSSLLQLIFKFNFKTGNTISAVIQSLLEITNGCNIISKLDISFFVKMIIISFIIGFSGLSIIGQFISILYNTKISINKYIISKLTQGVFSSICCFLILKYMNGTIESFNNIYKNTYFNKYYSILILIEILLMLVFVLLLFVKKKQNRHPPA